MSISGIQHLVVQNSIVNVVGGNQITSNTSESCIDRRFTTSNSWPVCFHLKLCSAMQRHQVGTFADSVLRSLISELIQVV